MGSKREALTAGFGAAVFGLGLLLAAPSSEPLALVLSGSLGATGSMLLAKKKQEEENTASQDSDLSESLENIKNLLAINTEELTALKQQIAEVRSQKPTATQVAPAAETPTAAKSIKAGKKPETPPAAQVQPHPVNYEPKYTADLKPVVKPADPVSAKPKNKQLVAWFKQHGATVFSYKGDQHKNPVLQEAAMLIGKHYELIKPLIDGLKTNHAQENNVEIDLQEVSEDSFSAMETVFQDLSRKKIITGQFDREAKKLVIDRVDHSDTITFFGSLWFKLFLHQSICELLQQKGLRYSAVWDITGMEGGKNFQMDLVFMIDGQPFWVACKTTKNYTQPVKRQLNLIERLKFPLDRQIMVLSEYDAEKVWDEETQAAIQKLSLAGLSQFLPLIEEKL